MQLADLPYKTKIAENSKFPGNCISVRKNENLRNIRFLCLFVKNHI